MAHATYKLGPAAPFKERVRKACREIVFIFWPLTFLVMLKGDWPHNVVDGIGAFIWCAPFSLVPWAAYRFLRFTFGR